MNAPAQYKTAHTISCADNHELTRQLCIIKIALVKICSSALVCSMAYFTNPGAISCYWIKKIKMLERLSSTLPPHNTKRRMSYPLRRTRSPSCHNTSLQLPCIPACSCTMSYFMISHAITHLCKYRNSEVAPGSGRERLETMHCRHHMPYVLTLKTVHALVMNPYCCNSHSPLLTNPTSTSSTSSTVQLHLCSNQAMHDRCAHT